MTPGAQTENTQTGDPNQPPVAFITGASSGIGAATARALCDAGYHVHGAARRVDRLHDLAVDRPFTAWHLDVCDADAVSQTISDIGPIDVLVNNAGLGRGWGSLADASYLDIERTVSTNVTAALHVAACTLPSMIERRTGHIVNIGSMAGLYPLPAALYGATKAAMHRLSTNLRLELHGTGVRVTEICPGRIATEFYDVAIDDPAERDRILATDTTEVTAAECADTIVYAVRAPKHLNINRIELQPVEQTYGGSQFTPTQR